MFLEYFSLGHMGLGNWEGPGLWLRTSGSNLVIIAGIVLLLIFLAGRMRGFWGFIVYMISGGVILICLKNIVRLW